MNDTQYANAALRMLGAARIGDVDERTPEAEVIRDVWALTRDSLLRSYRWNFAKKAAILSSSAGLWILPSDCLRVLAVNGMPVGLRGGPEVFGNALKFPVDSLRLSLAEAVSIDYIARVATPFWDPSFGMVFQFLLAAQIAPGLSAASGKAAELRQEAQRAVMAAVEANAIETAPLVIGAYGNLNVADTGLDAWLDGP